MNGKREGEREGPVTLFGQEVSPWARWQARRMVNWYAWKYRHEPRAFHPLAAEDNATIGPAFGVKNIVAGLTGKKVRGDDGIVIGTIRMGYGHYRMAMAITSAAHAMGLTPYWLDLLGFDTPGAKIIADTDWWYSLASRLSQQSRLFNTLVWEPLTVKAAKRVAKNYPSLELCRLFADIYKDISADMPFVGSHPWPAQAALFAGMINVINIIPDNWPLGFHLTPGALHTVQGPSAYTTFRMLKDMQSGGDAPRGVPSSDIKCVGHYVDHELAANIETDCHARMTRMGNKAPRRLLVSVGGAGAQQPLFLALAGKLLPLIKQGRAVLFMNFGDHGKVWDLMCRDVPGFEETAVVHSDWGDTQAFAAAARDGEITGLHAFLHEDVFAAVYTTNALMRAADILLTKPSELAYYPIPKLFLPRVGGHEAWGAIRGAEIGDGTVECTSAPLTFQALDMMIFEDDLLSLYCENILKLNRTGEFNGAYRVVELAMQRKNA